jgi:GNAT superfamily N-acetyltransferase
VAPETAAEVVKGAGEEKGSACVWRAGAGAPIGHLRWRLGWPEPGLAMVEEVEIAPQEQGLGYGSEAVLQLEGLLKERGVKGLAAALDLADGLGLFFWLRLGYRPMAAGQRPADGRFWMVRILPGA